MKRVAFITLLILSTAIYSNAFGQKIEIEGLRLGMAKTEIEEKFGALHLDKFKVANVSGKLPLRLAFHEEKLDELMFFFPSESFNDVRKAIVSRYPDLKCTDNTITSPAGKKFTQTNCRLKDQLGALKLDRFVRDIDTSALILISDRLFDQLEKERKEKEKASGNAK